MQRPTSPAFRMRRGKLATPPPLCFPPPPPWRVIPISYAAKCASSFSRWSTDSLASTDAEARDRSPSSCLDQRAATFGQRAPGVFRADRRKLLAKIVFRFRLGHRFHLPQIHHVHHPAVFTHFHVGV